jgi:hypothetical protein
MIWLRSASRTQRAVSARRRGRARSNDPGSVARDDGMRAVCQRFWKLAIHAQ